jgi:hypothetical protein
MRISPSSDICFITEARRGAAVEGKKSGKRGIQGDSPQALPAPIQAALANWSSVWIMAGTDRVWQTPLRAIGKICFCISDTVLPVAPSMCELVCICQLSGIRQQFLKIALSILFFGSGLVSHIQVYAGTSANAGTYLSDFHANHDFELDHSGLFGEETSIDEEILPQTRTLSCLISNLVLRNRDRYLQSYRLQTIQFSPWWVSVPETILFKPRNLFAVDEA